MSEPIAKIYAMPQPQKLYTCTVRDCMRGESSAIITEACTRQAVATIAIPQVGHSANLEALARFYNMAAIRVSRLAIGAAILHRLIENGYPNIARDADGEVGFFANFTMSDDPLFAENMAKFKRRMNNFRFMAASGSTHAK